MAQHSWSKVLGTVLRIAVDAARSANRSTRRSSSRRSSSSTPRPGPRSTARSSSGAASGNGYPGDFTGRVSPVYAPDLDGQPDPGEVVWTWVPYEENDGRGKDRPVLLVGHDGPWLLGLMLSSRDHDSRPAPADERWMDVGTGAWDSKGRPSEVRLDRVLRIDPDDVRGEGAVLDRGRFAEVARAM